VNSQKPPRGAYHNSKKISATLFTNESKQARDEALATEHMPFLFNLIFSKLKRPTINTVSPINGEQEDSDEVSDHVPEVDLQGNEMDPNNDFNINTPVDHNEQAYTVSFWGFILSNTIHLLLKFLYLYTGCEDHMLNGCICN
jgi:hypothetical protein